MHADTVPSAVRFGYMATPEQNLVSAFPVEYYFFNNGHIKLTEK